MLCVQNFVISYTPIDNCFLLYSYIIDDFSILIVLMKLHLRITRIIAGSHKSPYCIMETNFQVSLSMCGVINDMLISPVILEDRMRTNYLEFLQNTLPEQLENIPLATQYSTYLQHDGAPSHTRLVMQHLNITFPNRWISRGRFIGHKDLTSMNFCL